VGDIGENFGDWGDRGENGMRVGENTPRSPRSPNFPFPLTLGDKYEPSVKVYYLQGRKPVN
jgi:hypothetical protein